MGKHGDKKRKHVEEDDEEDPELEAELAAVLAMRAEKSGRKPATLDDDEDEDDDCDDDEDDEVEEGHGNRSTLQQKKTKTSVYDGEGMRDCAEGLGSHILPFLETMRVCEFEADIQDEHDDLQREVRKYYWLARS